MSLLLAIYTANAQSLEVIDEVSKQPVAKVLIYQQENNWSVSTDKLGQADISGATDSLLLFFQHPSFRNYAVLKKNAGSRIPLDQKVIHIEQVVVSANRWEQNVNQVPQEIMIISMNDIEQIQPQTSADMLSSTGQVFVQKSQLGRQSYASGVRC